MWVERKRLFCVVVVVEKEADMAGYGVTPLGSDGLAIGSVYPPNAPSGNPVPLQGGTINTDGSGNTSAPVRAELAPTQTVSGTLQSAATATGNGATLAVMGYASCVFTVTGTFVGTITFTGISQDGVTTTPLNCAKRGAGAIATTATTTGLYECNIPGLSAVEAVITAYTSGSITVTATALPVPLSATTVRIDANQPAIPVSSTPLTYTAAGQVYSAVAFQQIGASAAGWYGLSVFNPSTSGKNILITSIKGWNNGGAALFYLFKTTSDPALGTVIAPVNQKFGSTASVLTSSVTWDTTAISYPGATPVDTAAASTSQLIEVLLNGNVILLPSGSAFGVELITYVNNSASYGFCIKWAEY